MEARLPEMEFRASMAICIYTLAFLVFRMVLLRPTPTEGSFSANHLAPGYELLFDLINQTAKEIGNRHMIKIAARISKPLPRKR